MSRDDDPVKSTSAEATAEVAAIALSAVPVAGGVLSGIATAVISKRQNRRLNEFLTTLAADLSELKDSVNADFVATEEFQDLAEDVFAKAADTRQKEKLEAFRRIFLNCVVSENANYDEAAEMAAVVDRWQPRHIVLLWILADPAGADRARGDVVGPGGGLTTSISQILSKLVPTWDDEQIERTWQELYVARIHRTAGTKTMMTDKGIGQLENRLTEFGQKVAHYLSCPT